MLEAAPTTSKAAPNTTRAVSIQEPELPVRSGFPEPPTGSHLAQSPISRRTPAAHKELNKELEKGSFSTVVFLTTPNDNTFLHSPFIICPHVLCTDGWEVVGGVG